MTKERNILLVEWFTLENALSIFNLSVFVSKCEKVWKLVDFWLALIKYTMGVVITELSPYISGAGFFSILSFSRVKAFEHLRVYAICFSSTDRSTFGPSFSGVDVASGSFGFGSKDAVEAAPDGPGADESCKHDKKVINV